jgi:glycerophosphoryl diester phosphodiesterase
MNARGGRFRRAPAARPLVLGHRGARHAAPENTLRAFELARSEGADGVELDVRLDGSGEVVVFHDRTLTRITAQRSTARVDALTTLDLRAIDVGLGERVPLLTEVLSWARERDLCVNVELKSSGETRRALVAAVVARLAQEAGIEERILLSSFDPLAVRALASALPRVAVCWLIEQKQRFYRWGFGRSLFGAAGLNPEYGLLSASRVRRWKRGGGLINTWTVNDPAQALACSELGVDSIITDVPGRIVRALAQRSAAHGDD